MAGRNTVNAPGQSRQRGIGGTSLILTLAPCPASGLT